MRAFAGSKARIDLNRVGVARKKTRSAGESLPRHCIMKVSVRRSVRDRTHPSGRQQTRTSESLHVGFDWEPGGLVCVFVHQPPFAV